MTFSQGVCLMTNPISLFLNEVKDTPSVFLSSRTKARRRLGSMANREKKNSSKILKNNSNSEKYYERANSKKAGFKLRKKRFQKKDRNP